MLRIAEAVQITDTGRQREANEDSYFCLLYTSPSPRDS